MVTRPGGFFGAAPSGYRQRQLRRSAAIQLLAGLWTARAAIVRRARHPLRRISLGEGTREAHRATAAAYSLELSPRAGRRNAGRGAFGNARQSNARHLEPRVLASDVHRDSARRERVR